MYMFLCSIGHVIRHAGDLSEGRRGEREGNAPNAVRLLYSGGVRLCDVFGMTIPLAGGQTLFKWSSKCVQLIRIG